MENGKLRIAYITYEYPPDIPQGGIATYVQQAARAMSARGHHVEIFCCSHARHLSEDDNGVLVHRVKSPDPGSFALACVPIFTERHRERAFDIMESPEIHANALPISLACPEVPLVVKLHMALHIQMRLLNYYTPFVAKTRFFLGALRRGRFNYFGRYDRNTDPDYAIAKRADALVSPSRSLKEITVREWGIAPQRITVIPYLFKPGKGLLDIPVGDNDQKVVLFVGKLSVHKGLVNLARSVPIVAQRYPDVLFRLIGNDSFFAVKKMNMSDYIKKELSGLEKNYEITGGLRNAEIQAQLAAASVCIFPSIWENFPMVCMEAMAAGRAIIGSREGGMAEMLAGGAGIPIDPLDPKEMAEKIILLLGDKNKRSALGNRARKKLLEEYNEHIIGRQLEKHYEATIRAKAATGTKKNNLYDPV